MSYEGLHLDDLANVRALNAAWLELSRKDVPHSGHLTPRRRQRLAGTPFLLFSLQEGNDSLWVRLLNDDRQRDLLARTRQQEVALLALQATSLAFLWELSRRNPYVARLVSLAPLNWCEFIAAQTLHHVQASVANAMLIRPRFEPGSRQYRRLLLSGGSSLREARCSAQIAAMQALLTRGDIAQQGRLAAAACRMTGPARELADKV